jgi:Ca2+-binding RTX toxin-like protein
MRRITLLLIVMATALLAVSGVAWAVTKRCPPELQGCTGTNGDDVLKSSSQDNNMIGQAGNDTYTNCVSGGSGFDTIVDTSGTDKLLLTEYAESEVKRVLVDIDENGKNDSLFLMLGGKQHRVTIANYYDQGTTKPGPGYIEVIQFKK